MPKYEFKVVPAPHKGRSGKGIRGRTAKFAHALSTVMNEMGAEGWDYVRTDTLPFEERTGLMGSQTTYQNMMVFRRIIAEDNEELLYAMNSLRPALPEAVRMIESGGRDGDDRDADAAALAKADEPPRADSDRTDGEEPADAAPALSTPAGETAAPGPRKPTAPRADHGPAPALANRRPLLPD